MASGLCCLAALPTSRIRRALEWMPLIAIGQFSYSLYLVHAPMLAAAWVFFVKPLGLPSGAGLALMVFVVMPATVAASYGFHRAVERPFMRYRSWGELRAAFIAQRPALVCWLPDGR